jgi:hypothetical protein
MTLGKGRVEEERRMLRSFLALESPQGRGTF